jgi:hypothetical protein
MKRFSVLTISFLAFCQLGAAEFGVVATIIDTGFTQDGRQACIVQAVVKNQTQVPLSITMMTCSWDDSWFVIPEKDVEIPIWGCDSNYPTKYEFPAGGGFTFRFCVRARTPGEKIEGKKIQCGFLAEKWDQKRLLLLESREERARKFPTIWSEALVMPKVADKILQSTSERKAVPNQPPLPTPADVTPAAAAPVAPPSRAAGL